MFGFRLLPVFLVGFLFSGCFLGLFFVVLFLWGVFGLWRCVCFVCLRFFVGMFFLAFVVCCLAYLRWTGLLFIMSVGVLCNGFYF